MDGRLLPAWHNNRTLGQLQADGPYAHTARAIDLARVWVDRYAGGNPPRKGLLLYGPVGTGKTTVLAALACTLGVPDGCAYWDVRNLFAAAKSEMGTHVRDTVVDRAVKRKVLILDDVGKQRATEWAVETIRDMIERRFDRGGYTHVTTNLDPDELAGVLGPAAWSRLQAMCAPVPVLGQDLRMIA